MNLPILETPTYTLNLPSTGEKIKYRPFLVKEYKNLLTALDSDNEEILRIVSELVDVCTFNKLKIETLANFDIEYLFLNIRAKSIGETTKLSMACANCESPVDFEMDITKLEIKKDPEHTNKIMITDTMGVEMRYPKFEEMLEIYQNFKSDNIVSLVCNCINNVYTEEKIYDEFSREEVEEWVSGFSKAQFDKLEGFFLTMPKVTRHIESDCPSCGHKNTVDLEGLQNFFV